MPLIDYSFFVGDINIPNSTDGATLQRINQFIGRYESECLKLILGYNLFKLLTAGGTLPTRLSDLLDGAEYNDYDYPNSLQKWDGLVYGTNQSLIADYVYFYYQGAQANQSTGIGTVQPQSNAGLSVSPADKMIAAWNSFSHRCNDMLSFLRSKNDTRNGQVAVYPEFTNDQMWKTVRLTRPINTFGI